MLLDGVETYDRVCWPVPIPLVIRVLNRMSRITESEQPLDPANPYDIFLVPGQFPTIQAAVDAVVRPTTILIAPGLYSESVRVTSVGYLVLQSTQLSRRGVTLSGAGGRAVVCSEGSVLHLSGVEIRSRSNLRGMLIDDSQVSLQDCVIAGNRVDGSSGEPYGAGMLCRHSRVKIQKSTVAGNVIDGESAIAGGGGLYFEDCNVELAGSSVQVNAVYASGASRGGGIWAAHTRIRMWKSRVTDNAVHAASCEGGGLYLSDSLDCQIGGSVITGNGSAEARGGGIFVCGEASKVVVHANTVVRHNHPDDRAHSASAGTQLD